MRGHWRSIGLATVSVVLVFAWSSSPAIGGGQPTSRGSVGPQAIDPGCFTSGSGPTYMKVCVSADGTISSFESPSGFEHIGVGTVLEGYKICEGFATIHGYDAGGGGESGLGVSTVTQPNGPGTFPLTIPRTTLDGVFRVTQAFSRDAAGRAFRITMTLKNVSGATVSGVVLARFFDGDLDGDNADDIYDASVDSVWGRDQHALGLGLSTTLAHGAIVESFSDLSTDVSNCLPKVVMSTPTSPGDWGAFEGAQLGNMASGKSKTLKFSYRAF